MSDTRTDRSAYGYCDDCHQPAGAPCLDLRFSPRTGTFTKDSPHAGRLQLIVIPAHPEEAGDGR